MTRADAARQLCELADQIDRSNLDLSAEQGPANVTVADKIEFELSLKASDTKTELEVELTWRSTALV